MTGKTVAIVGSGPAGLAAAQRDPVGHKVAVFERADRPGGLLRYGIPEFKMEKRHVDRRLAQMEAEGTRFHNGVAVGTDVTGKQLRERYDAVVLAVGSTIPRDLPVPGRDAGGVLQAMQYLVPANRVALGEVVEGQTLATDKDVVVVGGGDTGADCVGTAIRQGARSVTQLEIMPRPPQERPATQPWPTYPMIYRVASAHEEGGERVYAVSTQEILADEDGQVRALRLVEVELVDGRFQPVEGSVHEIAAQLVLLAMGFTGPEQGSLLDQLGVDLTERGTVGRDDDFATNVPGVFVAGDAGRGQSLIVWAIAEGRSAAAAVDTYLSGLTSSRRRSARARGRSAPDRQGLRASGLLVRVRADPVQLEQEGLRHPAGVHGAQDRVVVDGAEGVDDGQVVVDHRRRHQAPVSHLTQARAGRRVDISGRATANARAAGGVRSSGAARSTTAKGTRAGLRLVRPRRERKTSGRTRSSSSNCLPNQPSRSSTPSSRCPVGTVEPRHSPRRLPVGTAGSASKRSSAASVTGVPAQRTMLWSYSSASRALTLRSVSMMRSSRPARRLIGTATLTPSTAGRANGSATPKQRTPMQDSSLSVA